MLEPKASRFYQAALQSGLVDEAGLDLCFDLIPAEKRTLDAIDRRLARQAISTGRLTLWQAQQILGGRSSGFKIDKYLLLDLLGRGGMGRVYLAKDLRLNRLVALKILSQERMNNPRAIARFQREAKVGAQLQHENLVRVYDEGDANGVRYLVMEYIEGKNVGQLIGELGAIPWPTASRLTRQVALGLDHARLKELIHRDVNPCNILVTQDGTAKLTDLGLAIDLNDQDNVTREGATVGTFDYVSPEQARHSRSVDTRADIYSLGCTIYHMIAGRVPFPVSSLPEKLYAHQLHDPDPLTEVVPGVPEGLAEVVRKMMRKRPEDRHQTPQEVAQALEPYALEAGWTATPSTSGSASAAYTPAFAPVSAAIAERPTSPDLQIKPASAGVATGVAEEPSSWMVGLSLQPGTEAGSGGSGNGSGSGLAVDGSFFPLDLVPDDPLSEGLKPAQKPWPGLEASAGAMNLFRGSPKAARFAVVAAAAVLALATVATLATLALSGPGFASKGGADPASGGIPNKPKPTKPPVRGAIVVLYGDGESESVKTLAEAMAMASTRAGAEVILAAGTTVRLDNSKTLRIADGSLTLRAAEGARPVLDLGVKGSQPMFLVNANLRLEGLTVVVRYETPSDAPIFQAERDLIMRRCIVRADGPTEGSQFVLVEGRKATVDGCLFEGFDTAVHVEANPGMAVSLARSIFLSAKPGDEAIGRAIRVHSMYGQGAGSRLSIENCSSRSGTFLDVSNFTPATPLDVEVVASALLVKTLLSYDGDSKTPLGADSAVRWKGRDNLYHITGTAWAAFANAPVGLEAWSKLAGEAGSKTLALKLAKEPPDPATPKDCALLDGTDKPVGADPAKVGPE